MKSADAATGSSAQKSRPKSKAKSEWLLSSYPKYKIFNNKTQHYKKDFARPVLLRKKSHFFLGLLEIEL